MKVSIRKFEESDIPNKVRWINDDRNNQYLHYELPLEIEKTEVWFQKNKNRIDRYDAIIEADNMPVGLIGLLSIDYKNKKAEYYIAMGEDFYKGKGIASKASEILLDYAFRTLHLHRVYLYTETKNIPAQRLFEKVGFKQEGIMKSDLFSRGLFVDRFVYAITKEMFVERKGLTPIQYLGCEQENRLFIKREDMIPYSFGGNKARKAKLFFEEIDTGEYDCVVTYGSSHSNHCRIISNMAAKRRMPCYIIAPEEVSDTTYNSRLMELFNAEFEIVSVNEVHNTIERKLGSLKEAGKNPYFIPGGGHGIIGTQAYIDCYNEIEAYEQENNIHFDYIFFASGTGTTQAGLICGQYLNGSQREIIGISIARKNPYGRDVILSSIEEYLMKVNMNFTKEEINKKTIFVDSYTGEGYGKHSKKISEIIQSVMIQYGVPLDSTYTGKAFLGMLNEIKLREIAKKNILFIHTGGTPLFFDELVSKKD